MPVELWGQQAGVAPNLDKAHGGPCDTVWRTRQQAYEECTMILLATKTLSEKMSPHEAKGICSVIKLQALRRDTGLVTQVSLIRV